MPVELQTPEDVTVILEDMVVRQQSKGNQEAKQGASETLAKIHEGLRIKLSREKTKTQQ